MFIKPRQIVDQLLAAYRDEEDPSRKDLLFDKAVYWSIEADIDAYWDMLWSERLKSEK